MASPALMAPCNTPLSKTEYTVPEMSIAIGLHLGERGGLKIAQHVDVRAAVPDNLVPRRSGPFVRE